MLVLGAISFHAVSLTIAEGRVSVTLPHKFVACTICLGVVHALNKQTIEGGNAGSSQYLTLI